MIYRISIEGQTGHLGYAYAKDAAEARVMIHREKRAGFTASIDDKAHTPRSKVDIMALLQRWGNYARKGG